MADHISHRKKIKARKPKFLAQDTLHKKRIRPRWKKPKGLQSKMRLNHAGQPANVSQGWRSPRSVRGFSSEGLEKVMVRNISDLKSIDSKKQGALIASSVSLRNKEKIHAECEKKGIKVLNRGASDFKKKLDAFMKARKDHKKSIDARRKKEKAKEKTEGAGKNASLEKNGKDTQSDDNKKTASVKEEEKKSSDKKPETKPAETKNEEKKEAKADVKEAEAMKEPEAKADVKKETKAEEKPAQEEKTNEKKE